MARTNTSRALIRGETRPFGGPGCLGDRLQVHHHAGVRRQGHDRNLRGLHPRIHRLDHAQRRGRRPRHSGDRLPHLPRKPAPGRGLPQHACRRRHGTLLTQRRGPAPLRRPGRRPDLLLHPVRARRRPPRLRQLRAARPEGPVHLHGACAAGMARSLQPVGFARRRARRRHRHHLLRPDPADLHLHHRGAGRPVLRGDGQLLPHACRRQRTGHPPERHLPRLDRRALRRAEHPGPDQDRAGLLPRTLRLPLPVGQVRFGVRARVQPRSHGKPGPGHVHRGLRLHLARHRGPARDPRKHHHARDGPHVVRRPGHHELVGRPLAQGVLRRLHRHPGQRRGHRVHHRLDHLCQPPQGLGVRRGPAAHHTPDRRGHHRPRSRQAELRRHHLRQGRLGAQAARRLRGCRRVPRRLAQVLPRPRILQHLAERLPCGSRGCLRDATWIPGPTPG